MQEEGYIAKLMYPAGAKDVKLGELIAILVEKPSDIAAFENYSGSAPVATAPAKTAPAQSAP